MYFVRALRSVTLGSYTLEFLMLFNVIYVTRKANYRLSKYMVKRLN